MATGMSGDTSRKDTLYSYVKAKSLGWAIAPFDTMGVLIADQSRIQWSLDTTSDTTLSWNDRWKGTNLSQSVRNPRLNIAYVRVPDTLQTWSSQQDPILAAQQGWLYLLDSMSTNPAAEFNPARSGLSLVPVGASPQTIASVPCYRPWIASAFVRLHGTGSASCSDTLSLNPNLLLSVNTGNPMRWNLEIYYPDGQTPNLDLAQGTGQGLQSIALRLSDDRSSQRWVRLQGVLPDTIWQSGQTYFLKHWSVFGTNGGKIAELDLPRAQTDSSNSKVGIHKAKVGDNFWTPLDTEDLAWWNVTGLQGTALLQIQGVYSTGTDSMATWSQVPFVIGLPRTSDSATVTDAYGRATLTMPGDSTNSQTPIVLNTLAGKDLAALPLNGVTPLGPVIQMSPSGTQFQPPASLVYRLTLREILALMGGTSLSQDSLTVGISTVRAAFAWASAQLAIWEISDNGTFQVTPTVFSMSGDTNTSKTQINVDATQAVLTGLIYHFSVAAVLYKDPSKNFAPRWAFASRSGSGLSLSLDALQAMALGANPQTIHVRLSAVPTVDSTRFAPGDIVLPLTHGQVDTTLGSIPSAWSQILGRGQSYAFARFDGSISWSAVAISDTSLNPTFGAVTAVPELVHSVCTDTVRLVFGSNRAGVARARVVNGAGAQVALLLSQVNAGQDTLSWPVCNQGTPALKGLYQALVEVVRTDGSTSGDSSLNLAVWGVDTAVPYLGPVQVPNPVEVPQEAAAVEVSAAETGWPSTSSWTVRVRRVLDRQAGAADSIWQSISSPSVGTDSLRAMWNAKVGTNWAAVGTWQAQIAAQAGSFHLTRSSLFTVDSENSSIALSLVEPGPIYVGDRVSAEVTGHGLSAWSLVIQQDSIGKGTTSGTANGDVSFEKSLRTDTLSGGHYQVCVQGTGLLGSTHSNCQDLWIQQRIPHLSSLVSRPQDTLWVGWPATVLEPHPSRMAQWVVTGQTDRSGSLIRQISQGGLLLHQDTLPLSMGNFSWTWDGTLNGKALPEATTQIKIWADAGASPPDTTYSTSFLLHRVPRVFVWSGLTADSLGSALAQTIASRGVTVARGDASAAVDFLNANGKGTLVLLDTAVSYKLWAGRSSGGLIPWTVSGGNAVFVGAPVLSAWRDSLNRIHPASDTDAARMAIYGVQATGSQLNQLQTGFRGGIRYAGLRVDSVDNFSNGIWHHDSNSVMPWSVHLRWFDSAGVEVESGLLHHRHDTIHYQNLKGHDTLALDTNLAACLNFYPLQDSGSRKGNLLELPTITNLVDADSVGGLIWAQLLIPDLGISPSDVRVTASPNGARDSTKWRPIPGDLIQLGLTLRVRDGGMDTLPDSAVIDLKHIPGVWNDTTLIVHHLKVGRVIIPPVSGVLPQNFPYGPDTINISVRPLRLGNLVEAYLRNNTAQGTFLVGDTSKPHLVWEDQLDSTASVPTRLVPVAAGMPFVATVRGWTRHHQPQWNYTWELRNSANLQIEQDSGRTVQPDTSSWALTPSIAADAGDGSYQMIGFRGRDEFGNHDSISLRVRVDSIPPKLLSFTVHGKSGQLDTANDSTLTFFLSANAGSTDTATIQISDNQLLGKVYLVANGTDSSNVFNTISKGPLTVKFPVPVSLNDTTDSTASNSIQLVVRDLAGNDTTVRFHVLAEPPPTPVLYHVRIPTLGGGLEYPTLLDSLNALRLLSAPRVDSIMTAGRNLLISPPTDSENFFGGRTNGDSGIIVRQSRRGVPMDFVLAPQSDVLIDSMVITLDGTRIDTPATVFKKFAPAILTHPTQRLFEVTPTKSHHRLVVRAYDMLNDMDSLVVMLDDSLADLQVIDSAGDNNGQGADWGEVYMRRNVSTPPGFTIPQTWDYWLIQRRNPLVVGERDNHLYRLLVDEDGDSTTGDTTSGTPRGFRGADVALEWTNLTTADDGSAAQVSLYRWSDSLKTWILSATNGEGLDLLDGFGFHMNEVDNPATDSVGRGDQRLPSGTIAPASGGVTEVGIRSGSAKSLNPIRWAIIPDGFAGDTVRSANGGMLTFTPEEFKPVTVDGDDTDWWPNNTPVGIEVLSRTDSVGDTLRVWIGLKNLGTKTIHGLQLAYWLTSDSAPFAVLSGVPSEWRSLNISGIDSVPTKAPNTWKISMLCGDCSLPGGTNLAPVAILKIFGHGVSLNRSDDWSNASDTSVPNPHFPAYDMDGNVLFGSEPPPRALRLPVARITPSGVLWTTVGQPLVLRADSSYDPELHKLVYQWWQSGTGTNHNTVADTFVASTPGVYTISLEVYDSADASRAAWATDSVFVQDSLGSMGSRPVLTGTQYIFDDQWDAKWNQSWVMPDSIVASDSLLGPDGSKHLMTPYRGTKMTSLRFDTSGYLMLRATCDSSYWDAQGASWCHDEVDLTKYSNLEFKVAMDAGVKQPVRIWLDRGDAGQGNGAREEDFAYVNGYLSDMSDPSHWQTVSIPLREVYTEPQIRGGWLQLKIMTDDAGQSPLATHPRVLLDDIRLVKYSTQGGQIVTTRKTGLQVLVNTRQNNQPDDYLNQFALTVRLLNQGSVPLQLDSMRLRAYYQTREGQLSGDTTWGSDTVDMQTILGLPIDSTIDAKQLVEATHSLGVVTPPNPLANEFGQIQWVGNTPGPDAGLRLQTTASASFWMVVENFGGSIGDNTNPWEIPMIRFNGGHSLAWSWPDSANFFQFAPRVVVDHLEPNGTWARAWGLAPNESPATVSYWSPENLVDPSRSIDSLDQIRAHITVAGTTSPGAHLVASAAASVDPIGHPLQYDWLDSLGRVIRVGAIDSFVVPDTGEIVLRLRVFDYTDPTRIAADSLVVYSLAPGKAADSTKILTGHGGTWVPGSSWGTGSTSSTPSWKASVDLVARDGDCPVRLHPIGSDSILVVPFSDTTVDGVQFVAPNSALDRSRFTHLEFWVATGRDWPSRDHRDLPVRVWLTHQIQPGPGDDNHASEEDFNLVQAYLADEQIMRGWQKVSIPLDELFQSSLPANSDSTKLFLKFMLDRSHTSRVDTARRADLYLTGMRFAKYGGPVRVTTRRVGAILFGQAYAVGNSATTRLDLRLLNPTHLPLLSDSLRLRLPYWSPASVGMGFSNNSGGMGTDESVADSWFSPIDSAWDFPLAVDPQGRKANHAHQLTWSTSSPLIPGKGWEGIWTIGYNDSLFLNGVSRQHFAPDLSNSFSLLTGLVAEYKNNGLWSRIWGYDAGENPDTVNVWGREPVSVPSDTAVPSGSVESLTGSCTDTTGTGGTTSGTSNTSIAAGDVSGLPSNGRDPLLSTQEVSVGGKAAVQVIQSKPDWNIKHTFVFDTAWADHSVVDVDVYVDPSEMTGTAWPGTLSAATFDGLKWITLNLVPLNDNGLQQAEGQWVTLRFQYAPSQYTLGESFDIMFLANGHGNGTQSFQFDIGAVRLEGANGSDTSGSGSSTGSGNSGSTNASNGLALDSLGGLTSCNQCTIVHDGTRTAISLVPNGGGTILSFSTVVDSAFNGAHTLSFDLKSEFALQGWEQAWFMVNDAPYRYQWDQYTANIPVAASSGWVTLSIPFNGSLYGLGTTAQLMLSLNANAPSGMHMIVDNVRWTP